MPRASKARGARGRWDRGRGRREWKWESPLSETSISGGSAPASQSGVLLSAEPGSRRLHRQQGALQRPLHRPLSPPGPGTSAAKALRPDIPRAGSSSRRGPAGTPQPLSALRGCKTPPPVPLLSLPSSRGRREESPQATCLRLVGDSGRGGPAPPSRVTCEHSDTDLMVVVSEDHSLGRHVSQRSHRTDRSREKPEPGARGPGARSPRRARERERPGNSRGAEKEGEAARLSAACAG